MLLLPQRGQEYILYLVFVAYLLNILRLPRAFVPAHPILLTFCDIQYSPKSLLGTKPHFFPCYYPMCFSVFFLSTLNNLGTVLVPSVGNQVLYGSKHASH
ncbi:hypothetical protein FKM82_014708 [Ascaphus truei]